MNLEVYDISAVVEAIDLTNDRVTLVGPRGNMFITEVDDTVVDMGELIIGDAVHVRYTQSLVVDVEPFRK